MLAASISAVAGLFALLFVGMLSAAALIALLPPPRTLGAGIVEALAATICLYLVSIAFRLLTRGRSGYRDEATAVQSRRFGEPVLLGISFTLATIAVSFPAAWHHRLAAADYARSKLCYARMETVHRVPRLNGKFAPRYLDYQTRRSSRAAEERGALLGMRRELVDKDLAETAAAYFRSYAQLTPPAAQRKDAVLLNDLAQCLNDG